MQHLAAVIRRRRRCFFSQQSPALSASSPKTKPTISLAKRVRVIATIASDAVDWERSGRKKELVFTLTKKFLTFEEGKFGGEKKNGLEEEEKKDL